jgi:hypothetical protein
MWVFWVHVSSYTRFEQGYRNIANVLKLPGREDDGGGGVDCQLMENPISKA